MAMPEVLEICVSFVDISICINTGSPPGLSVFLSASWDLTLRSGAVRKRPGVQ